MALLTACNPARRIAEGEALLTRCDITFEQPVKKMTADSLDTAMSNPPDSKWKNRLVPGLKSKKIPAEARVNIEDMYDVLKQRPNRRILFVRFNLRVYNMINPAHRTASEEKKALKNEARMQHFIEKRKSIEAKPDSRKKQNKLEANQLKIEKFRDKEPKTFRTWWSYSVGEAPVVLDSSFTVKSARQLEIFLARKGYFHAAVDHKIKLDKKGDKASVKYLVSPGKVYKIGNVTNEISDPAIKLKLSEIAGQSVIKKGIPFDLGLLEAERSRIADFLNDEGYYAFSKDYVLFEADSALNNYQVDLNMRIVNLSDSPYDSADSLKDNFHQVFHIRNVFVHMDYKQGLANQVDKDTLEFDNFTLLFNDEPFLRPIIFKGAIDLKPGDLYRKSKFEKSYRNLSAIGVYKSVNIRMVEPTDTSGVLDLNINMSKGKTQSLSLETGGTHRAGALGINGNIVYKHRNIFSGAEVLQGRLLVGVEASNLLNSQGSSSIVEGPDFNNKFKFNTFEIGPELSLQINRFIPFGYNPRFRLTTPKTNINVAFNYQNRTDYERTLTKVRYGYEWVVNPNKMTRMYLDIWELSYIDIVKSEEFQAYLDSLNDPFLSNSYENQIITSSRWGHVINTARNKNQRKYFYNQFSVETAGNLLRMLHNVSGKVPDENGSYLINGIAYAQYVKFDNDFRFYRKLKEGKSVAFRVYSGIGLTGKNLNVLPFDKSYFAGGTNDIRGWQARTLGPGSFRDSIVLNSYNNIGDIKLLGASEYRFDVTSLLEGAVFIDIGNIWMSSGDGSRQGTQFRWDSFLSEMAFSGGVGLRLDFDFFLLRFDLAAQLKDPAKVPGERWFWEPKDNYYDFLKNFYPENQIPRYYPLVNFNLGIGYPF